jgi:hypothetical protein
MEELLADRQREFDALPFHQKFPRLVSRQYHRTLNRIKPWPHHRLRWFIQRGRRGWADCDVWSLDSYTCLMLSGALIRLAERNHAYPGEGSPWETPEKWDAYLRDLADRLKAWDRQWFDMDAYGVTRKAMEEFGRNLGYFWD